MELATLGLKETGKFSKLFLDYIEQANPKLKEFYTNFPVVENFASQLESKKFSAENRKILCGVLQQHYAEVPENPSVSNNITSLLDPKTFTITTGHQLNIFTGPLYFIFKIITVINACKELKAAYPEFNFVPIYWMASEDHDFDEINHFFIEGKKYQWETQQKGAVGRFETSELASLAKQVPGMPAFFSTAYRNADNLAEACRNYVHSLFGDEGLVVVDADDSDLKRMFRHVIEDDIFNHSAETQVTTTSAELEKLGYTSQVFAREINFFYLNDNIRERIELSKGRYEVLNTSISFTKEEIKREIDEHPDRFSPNVILRPVYQETILPNLAYIGGPSEVAYWFQLKSIFDHYQTPFPILMPRNFAAIVPHHMQRKANKTGLTWAEFFRPFNEISKEVALNEAQEAVLLNGEKTKILSLFEAVKKQAEAIDSTLVAHVEAQATRTASTLQGIEKKFIRAEKRKYSEKLGQIEAVYTYLFPNGGLQERRENILSFLMFNPDIVRQLLKTFEAFNFRFYILSDGK